MDIPHRDLSTAEAARLWGEDRRRLGDCRALNHAKGETIKALTGATAGATDR